MTIRHTDDGPCEMHGGRKEMGNISVAHVNMLDKIFMLRYSRGLCATKQKLLKGQYAKRTTQMLCEGEHGRIHR